MTEQAEAMSNESVDPVALKKARFEKDPDSFIHMDDIIMATVRQEGGGISTLHGAAKRIEMEISLTRLNYKTTNIMMQMDLQNEMRREKESKSELILPGQEGGNGRHRKPLV